MPIVIMAVAALALLAVATAGPSTSAPAPKKRSRIRTGPVSSQLLTFHLDRGTVRETPDQVAAAIERKTGKSLHPNVVALATMIASETGSGPRQAKIGVAWAAKNEAKRRGIPILKLLAPKGRFGQQGLSGRSYAATARPPNPIDLDVAAKVYTGQISDITAGSIYFDSPAAFKALEGTEGYEGKTAEEVAAARRRAGLVAVHLPGVNPNYLRLWRHAA